MPRFSSWQKIADRVWWFTTVVGYTGPACYELGIGYRRDRVRTRSPAAWTTPSAPSVLAESVTSPDCGMWMLPRSVADGRLRALGVGSLCQLDTTRPARCLPCAAIVASVVIDLC